MGLFGQMPIAKQVPNLLFLFTIFFALEKKGYDFYFIAFISGLLLDFFYTGFFGSFTLAFLISSSCLHLLSDTFIVFELNWKSLSGLLFGALAVAYLVVWLYGLMVYKFNWTHDFESFSLFSRYFLINFLYNWALLYPMYIVYTLLKQGVDSLTIRRRGIVR